MTVKDLKEVLEQYADDMEIEFTMHTTLTGQAEVVTGSYETEYGWDYDTETQDVDVEYDGELELWDADVKENKVVFTMEEV